MRSVVLVTGGAGFIGSHVVDRLRAAGHRARIFDCRPSQWHEAGDVDTVIGDVRRVDDLVRAMDGCSAVCHLAAAADVGEVHAQPLWATELNSVGTLSVLEAARRAGVRRVVYASTVWVYSDVAADEVDEETLLPRPAHLYTAGKLSGELFCHSYAELYGIESTVLRFGIPYGPRARPAAVIPSFVERALRGEPLTIAGSGDQERAFVYVEDLAEGVVRGLAPEAAGRTYNLTGDETTTIRGLAEMVSEEVATAEIHHTEGRAGDLRGARVLSDRARCELGWHATTPLRDGIRQYAGWLRDGIPATDAPGPVFPEDRRQRSPITHVTRLAAALADPVLVGIVALIAVASATVSVILGAAQHTQAADFTVLGIAFMLPLWSLTATRWPPEAQRAQGFASLTTAAAGVVVLGLLSGNGEAQGDLHGLSVLSLLMISATLSGLLRVVSRRLAGDAA